MQNEFICEDNLYRNFYELLALFTCMVMLYLHPGLRMDGMVIICLVLLLCFVIRSVMGLCIQLPYLFLLCLVYQGAILLRSCSKLLCVS